MRWALGIGGVVVIGALVAATYLPITKYERLQVCLHCGANKQDTVNFGFRRSTPPLPTEFSNWFDRRVGLPHDHRWKEEFSWPVTGEKLWGKRWKIERGDNQAGIVTEYQVIGQRLLHLESMKRDVELWREVTHGDENRAEQARSLAWDLAFDGPEDELRAQWSLAKRYLEDRGAWADGFGSFQAVTRRTEELTAPATSNP